MNFATDQVFIQNEPLTCDMSVPLWIFAAVWFPFSRLILAVGHTFYFIRKKRRTMQENPPRLLRGKRRFPSTPIVSWILFFLYLALFSLTSVNYSSVPLNLCIYGLGWLMFGLTFLLYLAKLVSVGHRISPRSGLLESSKEVENLSKFDTFGKSVFVLAVISLTGQTVSFCILSWSLPGDYVVVRIANAFDGVFILTICLSLMYQFHRLIKVYALTNIFLCHDEKELTSILLKD